MKIFHIFQRQRCGQVNVPAWGRERNHYIFALDTKYISCCALLETLTKMKRYQIHMKSELIILYVGW